MSVGKGGWKRILTDSFREFNTPTFGKMTLPIKYGDVDKRGRHPVFAKLNCPECGTERWVTKSNLYKMKSLGCTACVNRKKIINWNKIRILPHGKDHHLWKGGTTINDSGYVLLTISPEHKFYAMARSNNRVREHRLVMAEFLGRPLEPWEMVHHKDGNRSNNHIDNLELISIKLDHELITKMQSHIKFLENENFTLRSRPDAFQDYEDQGW